VTRDARRYAAEAIGTALLVGFGAGAVMTDAATGGALGALGIAATFLLAVAALVACLGDVSGAHLNPAVTLAFWSVRRFPGREVLPYVAAQCGGAVAAALLLRGAFGLVASVGATVPRVPTATAFGVEFVFSFALFLVIAAVATDPRTPPGVAPLAVGGTVGLCALQGALTGASMNPARSLGPAVASGTFDAHWLYWAAPVAGMVTAARLSEWLRGARAHPAVPRDVPLGVEGPIG
jgi:aquaporin Z